MPGVTVASGGRLFHVQAGQPFQAQAAAPRAAPTAARRPPSRSVCTSAVTVSASMAPGRQQRQFGGIAAADALHEAAVRCQRRQRPAGQPSRSRAEPMLRRRGGVLDWVRAAAGTRPSRSCSQQETQASRHCVRRANALTPNGLTLVPWVCCRPAAPLAVDAHGGPRGRGRRAAAVGPVRRCVADASLGDSAAHRRMAWRASKSSPARPSA